MKFLVLIPILRLAFIRNAHCLIRNYSVDAQLRSNTVPVRVHSFLKSVQPALLRNPKSIRQARLLGKLPGSDLGQKITHPHGFFLISFTTSRQGRAMKSTTTLSYVISDSQSCCHSTRVVDKTTKHCSVTLDIRISL